MKIRFLKFVLSHCSVRPLATLFCALSEVIRRPCVFPSRIPSPCCIFELVTSYGTGNGPERLIIHISSLLKTPHLRVRTLKLMILFKLVGFMVKLASVLILVSVNDDVHIHFIMILYSSRLDPIASFFADHL